MSRAGGEYVRGATDRRSSDAAHSFEQLIFASFYHVALSSDPAGFEQGGRHSKGNSDVKAFVHNHALSQISSRAGGGRGGRPYLYLFGDVALPRPTTGRGASR